MLLFVRITFQQLIVIKYFQRVLTDGDDTPEELEEKRRAAIAAAQCEDDDCDGADANGGADGDHEGKLLTGEYKSGPKVW